MTQDEAPEANTALEKALCDHFTYAARLRTGEVVTFDHAERFPGGWVRLYPEPQGGFPTKGKRDLPFPAPRGLDVREDDIVWVMDAPYGS